MAEKIIIDAGHNGLTDPGAVFQGRRESDDVLRLARAVGDILARNGYDIDYTRTGDISQSVVQKAQYANNSGADLFISLHRNMGTYPEQYNGVQTLIYDRNGIKPLMAENINSNLEGVGFKNINVETRTDLAVLRRTTMPALLVEVGFIDSARDNELFDTRFDEIAQAIADGIMDTLNAGQANTAASAPVRFASAEPMPVRSMPAPAESSMPVRSVSPDMPFWPLPAEESTQPQSGKNQRPLYRVQVGAFYNLQNAIELEQELKRLGYNTWIVTV